MRKWVWRSVGLVLLLAAALVGYQVAYRRSQVSDEDRIRAVLLEAERAVEAKDLRGCLKLVSEDYRDQYGNSKRELYRKALGAFRSPDPFAVTVNVREIRIEGDEAHASLSLDVAVGERTERGVAMDVAFRREGRHWRVISATNFEELGSVL